MQAGASELALALMYACLGIPSHALAACALFQRHCSGCAASRLFRSASRPTCANSSRMAIAVRRGRRPSPRRNASTSYLTGSWAG